LIDIDWQGDLQHKRRQIIATEWVLVVKDSVIWKKKKLVG
jgi:hypothetical protein